MEYTNKLLSELGRCELSDFNDTITADEHYYNGVSEVQGRDSYYTVLSKLYNEFLNEVTLLLPDSADTKRVLLPVYKRAKGIEESYFDVPTQEAIISLERDLGAVSGGDKQKMKNELGRMKFFKEMRDTQVYFLKEAVGYLEPIVVETQKLVEVIDVHEGQESTPVIPAQAIMVAAPIDAPYVYGYAGIMTLMGCGRNTACKITKILRGADKVFGGPKSLTFFAEDVRNYMKHKKVTRRKNG